ncbi:MAG: hypothetical protein JW748_04635 [Anaerolineales bacterium]|nr:hypothetical protein [Anaerolineales bacterium]
MGNPWDPFTFSSLLGSVRHAGVLVLVRHPGLLVLVRHPGVLEAGVQ